MNDRCLRPGQQRWHNKPHPLSGARRGKTQHVLGPVVPKILSAKTTKDDPVGAKQPSAANFVQPGPARRTVGRNRLAFSSPPNRHDNGRRERPNATRANNHRPFTKDAGRIRVEPIPPQKERGRSVDWEVADMDPGRIQLRLKAKPPGGPLRRRPGVPSTMTTMTSIGPQRILLADTMSSPTDCAYRLIATTDSD
jgi:hypothetical protein